MAKTTLLTNLIRGTCNPSRTRTSSVPGYTPWLGQASPEYTWDWDHLKYVRKHLADVTRGTCRKLAISWPPQHAKTESVTVRYPLWRMLRTPGLRVGVASYNQRFTNKQSRKTKKLAKRLGLEFGEPDAVDEWVLANGSTFIARGAGAGIAGEPLDLLVIDDPFKNRQEADSETIQERVAEWYMDDVTPRIQKAGALILIHTRWGPGDLIGRIQASEEGPEWRYVVLKALAEEGDPLGRAVGEPLCPDRFTRENLEAKRRTEGVGFESLYQQNPIPRGGMFFERRWFGTPLPAAPEGAARRVRYWDLARSRKDSACFTAGVLMAKVGDGERAVYAVEDVVRGRWMPAERNEVMLATAAADKKLPGFSLTYFEEPTHDTAKESGRAIVAKLAGYSVAADRVSGSKEMRAEPLATAAKGGVVKVLAGAWTGAYLTEMESFPRGTYKDQVDSSSGAFNKLAAGSPVAGLRHALGL